MKKYYVEWELKHGAFGIEADSEEEAKEKLKSIIKEQDNISLSDEEITKVEEVSNETEKRK